MRRVASVLDLPGAVLTLPWFAFQGQREAVLHVVQIMLVIAATLNLLVWRTATRR